MFITIEGIEGGGKTTQVGLLAAALERAGVSVLITREPGGTALGAEIRKLLLESTAPLSRFAELFLILADRAEHLETTLRPALADGKIVLCDRFADSTIAYQAYGRELPLESVRAVEEIARQGLGPDLTFVLDCPVAVGLARTRTRRGGAVADRFEGAEADFHERVRAGFLALAEAAPQRIRVVDASRPPQRVHEEILAESERRLRLPRR